MWPPGAPWGPLGPLGPLGGWFSKPGDRGVVSIFKKFTKIDIFGIFWLPNGGFGVQNGGSKLGDRSWGAAFGKHLPRNPTSGTHTVSLCGNGLFKWPIMETIFVTGSGPNGLKVWPGSLKAWPGSLEVWPSSLKVWPSSSYGASRSYGASSRYGGARSKAARAL